MAFSNLTDLLNGHNRQPLSHCVIKYKIIIIIKIIFNVILLGWQYFYQNNTTTNRFHIVFFY